MYYLGWLRDVFFICKVEGRKYERLINFRIWKLSFFKNIYGFLFFYFIFIVRIINFSIDCLVILFIKFCFLVCLYCKFFESKIRV